MVILSIDTSTRICSVALHNQGELLAEINLHVAQSHSEKLAVICKDILAYAGVKQTDVKAVAVAAGPGSYTGLRIGTSTAKGLCYALDIPLIAVNTLRGMANTMALKVAPDTLLCPMLDARRMEVYCMLTDTQLNIIKPTAPVIVTENSFAEILSGNKVLFFGNGAAKCQPVLQHPNASFLTHSAISAASIGQLAWQKFKNNEFEDLAYFEPDYLKEFQAIKPKNLFA